MSEITMTLSSLANKLQDLEFNTKTLYCKEAGYGWALREAIADQDLFMEVEVLKSLGDLHLQEGKLYNYSKDPAEFDKAAALYAAALLRCKDPDMGQTLEHRIGYMEKLSRQLLQGYSPHFRWLSQDYWGTADSNVLRVAEICDNLDKSTIKSKCSIEQVYTETLVTAMANSDLFLELEVLKSLGDFYLEKGEKTIVTDLSQFPKAVNMYKKALKGCEDPETRQTLHHRISYTEKTMEVVRMRSVPNKSRPKYQEQRTRKHSDMTSQDKVFKFIIQEGEASLARADLDSAEQYFAAALKMVHVRDPTAQQYQREVEPLCKLGDVYSKRGQQTGDGGDFVKAAALYNAAIARSEDQVLNGNIESDIRELEMTFLKCILGNTCKCNVSQDYTETHKKQLKEMRDQIKLEMETIDQQLDPYVHDEDDPCVREIEAKRAQAVRHLFDRIAQQRNKFISLLVEECIGLMGPPPCKYALIGLGSQATGLVTPYSDLEFAILVEEESEECLVYFRNLSHYLHLKVVNLEETILPALGIKSLNDFYSKNPLDNWYYDSVTTRGFAFDGSMPKASKTPLGRQGTVDEPSSELICTPENMASILQKDVTLYLKEGYHLATILRNPSMIAGDQGLIHTYIDITVKMLQADGGKMGQELMQETLKENNDTYKDHSVITARLIDVKKEIYRFPAVAVDCLALSSGIIPTTVWKTIEEMENQEVISPNNAHHLTVLTSISAELRLRTYIANGGQKENFSALASIKKQLQSQESSRQTNDEVQTSALKQIFHLHNEKQLFRYYCTGFPLKQYFSKWSEQNLALQLPFQDFYTNSAIIKLIMYSQLCKYSQAIRYFKDALMEAEGNVDATVRIIPLKHLAVSLIRMGHHQQAVDYLEEALTLARTHGHVQGVTMGTDTHFAELLGNLGIAWGNLGDHKKAISYFEQALQIKNHIYGQSTAYPIVAALLAELGSAWYKLGDYRKAISYHEEALQIYRTTKRIYGYETTAHFHIAHALNSLGIQWHCWGDYKKAMCYYEQALQMRKDIYGFSTAHPEIAKILNNIGVTWSDLGDNWLAISYHEQALQMNRNVYGESTPYSDIALTLHNLGNAWHHLGDYRTAISYHEKALQMYRSIYGESTPHSDIAASLRCIGEAWGALGDYRKASSYYKHTLEMTRSFYGKSTPHADIAKSLNNLGVGLHRLGDHRKAITYHEEALQMFRRIYGQTTEHRDIAISLNNLGETWGELGHWKKAISYHEQALQMRMKVYGQSTTAHPDIADSITNMGVAWHNLNDSRKAIIYCEQALEMQRSIFGQTTDHPHIARSLNSIGLAWQNLDDSRKAITYHEQALQMYRSTYVQTKAHPDIARSLNNMGNACFNLHDFQKAISYYEQALQMHRCVYGQTTAHSDIAMSLHNLGIAWVDLGDYKKGISYNEQALQMLRSVYGQTTAHPYIAKSLINMGVAWERVGDYKNATSYHEQALQIYKSIYGQTTAHIDIANQLNGLGASRAKLGDYGKSVSYYEQALQMYRSIYGQTTAHSDIAKSLQSGDSLG
uniref:Uncharacterized protein n=1 Tax=Branchiostoma floridae TaxID=7739 RepID=C3YHX6_BRAFL|eukprot:XP_002604102.1 hypothetical protein BRAFLDRAFT_71609 [Branchiostoma floridae]